MKQTLYKNNGSFALSIIIFLLINHYSNYQLTRFDGTGYIVLLLSFIYLFVNRTKYKLQPFLSSKAVLLWGGLMVYHIINAWYKGAVEGLESQSIIPCTAIEMILMTLCAYLYVIDRGRLFWTLIISLGYYLLIAYNKNEVMEDGRLSGFLFTTQLGQMAGVLCIIISLLIYYKQKFTYAILYAFPVLMMFLAGSRNGMLTVLFALVVLAVPYLFQHKRYLIPIFVLAFVLYYYLQDSLILERTDNYEYDLQFQTGTLFDYLLGDRIYYYVVGWQNFLDNPIFGIGLLNFQNYNYSTYPIHSEPMTHLAEGGLIGTILYLLFKGHLLLKLRKYCGIDKPTANQCLVIFIALFMIGLTARIYHYEFFFPLFGILIGEIYINENKTQ